MVQGRLDLQAPLTTAWELKQLWPQAELVVVDGAEHSSEEPCITTELLRATARFGGR